MKKFNKILWGLVLIAIGIILGGNYLGIFHIDVFFKGWWTLFIIVPSVIGLLTDNEKTGSIIGIIVGVALLLAARDIITFETVGKLFLPLVIVIIGLSIIFKEIFNKKTNEEIKELNKKIGAKERYTTVFSGQDIVIDGEEFKGTTMSATFGGMKLDLRDAIINEDIIINASAVFGGIDIFVPDGYKVKVTSNSVFGDVSNNKKYKLEEDAHIIYINATCIFGGVEIK